MKRVDGNDNFSVPSSRSQSRLVLKALKQAVGNERCVLDCTKKFNMFFLLLFDVVYKMAKKWPVECFHSLIFNFFLAFVFTLVTDWQNSYIKHFSFDWFEEKKMSVSVCRRLIFKGWRFSSVVKTKPSQSNKPFYTGRDLKHSSFQWWHRTSQTANTKHKNRTFHSNYQAVLDLLQSPPSS